jgi:hypothetical protein
LGIVIGAQAASDRPSRWWADNHIAIGHQIGSSDNKFPKNAAWLLALRVTNDVTGASDPLLEEAASLCERIAVFFGNVIVAGVLFEVWLAWKEFPANTRIGHWGPVWADIVVAVGVGLEVIIGFRGTRFQSELTQRSNKMLTFAHGLASAASGRAALGASQAGDAQAQLAEAIERLVQVEFDNGAMEVNLERATNDLAQTNRALAAANELAAKLGRDAQELRLKAAEAETRFQRLSNPRVPNRDTFLKALDGQAKPTKIVVSHSSDGADCGVLAAWIAAFLRDAGWQVDPPFPSALPNHGHSGLTPAQVAGGQPWGVTILDRDLSKKDGAGRALFNALREAMPGELVASSRTEILPDGELKVVIAPRP